MTAFWVVAGIFIAAALLFVLPTLLQRRHADGGVERDAANVTIYRDQLAELESDLRNDVLTKEQYEQSKRELQQRMLQDVPEGDSMTAAGVLTAGGQRSIATSAVITLAIPLLAVSLYLLLGNTKGLAPQAEIEAQAMMEGGGGHAEMSSVMGNLLARLKEQPDDIEGWIMLGRTYAIMGRYNEAQEAYINVLKLSPNNPELLADYADILAMTNNGTLAGKPTEVIRQALSIDPKHPKALALAGTAEFEKRNFKQAAAYWEQLLVQLPPESQLAKSVSESIAEAKSMASGGKPAALAELQQKASGGGSPPPQSERGTPAAAANPASDSISGTVTLSPSLAGKASPNDTLFIFARAKEGPKVPLAILRLQVKNLPATYTLSDSMAMMPQMKMSNFPEVVIGARISKSGKAIPESGDLQGFSRPVKLGDKGINFVIDQQVP